MLSRRSMAVVASVLLGLLSGLFLPGAAQAAPPSNDDFDTPAAITSLPFTTTIDTTDATAAADDPRPCNGFPGGTVWFRYTATENAVVTMSARAGRFPQDVAAYTGTRGALTAVPDSCPPSGPPGASDEATFHVVAGTTYHLVADAYSGDGPVTFDLRVVPTPANDARSGAADTVLNTQYDGDTRQASAEPDELTASCEPRATQSLWYRFTATAPGFHAAKTNYGAISAYRASDLSEVDCLTFYTYNSYAVFNASPGETFLIRVAAPIGRAKSFKLEVNPAVPFQPVVNASAPFTTYTDARFTIFTGDERKPMHGTIDFGDGHSTAIDPGKPTFHRYAADGDYTVTATGHLSDGRTGSGTIKIRVETHDVALRGLAVPATARAGQTKTITATVANTRYDEDVRVTLFKVGANGTEEQIGQSTQRIAANGRARFPFSYPYTAADVKAGTVKFRAFAEVLRPFGRGDDRPDDNEARGTTSVRR